MKICLILLLSSAFAFSNVKFDKIKTLEGFARNYELTSVSHKKSINLDCQSFIHKFDIYDKGKLSSENYISQSECNILETKVHLCLKKTKQVCFNNQNIYEASCNCRK